MDDLSRNEMEQLFGVFRDQTLQILDEMSLDVLQLESRGNDGETLGRLRRAAHTIKGDSACLGLDGVTAVAHRLEDLFDLAGGAGQIFEKRVVDAMLKALDAIRIAVGGETVEDLGRETTAQLLNEFDAACEEAGGERFAGESATPASEPLKLAEEAGRESGKDVARPRREVVRVEAQRIDAPLNLAGEMVIARSAMEQLGREMEDAFPKNETVQAMARTSAQLAKLIAELQKSVLRMRMVMIDQMFRRFTRPMRELAAERGKSVEIEVQGGDTELDRSLVDLLYEPMLHLLRNAVDHGIETREERAAMGKPEAGRIRLRAYHEGNQIVIEVSDDGRGIDIERLKAKAVETGALTPSAAAALSDEEALDLMFLSGLSTASEVSWVSGRGIGAAAVKSVVEQLRGGLRVRTAKGEGTTFILRLPLTLAIIKGLLFRSSGHLLALPLLTVTEIVRVTANDLVLVDGHESYRWRDQFLSVVRPGLVLGFERRRGGPGAALRDDGGYLMVVKAGEARYAMMAETVIGEQELVIKPLDGRWVSSEALAGASVLGDGQVALILDAGMAMNKAVSHERARGVSH